MKTLTIFLKRIRWLFIVLGGIFFLVSYIGLMVYLTKNNPKNQDVIIAIMMGGLFGAVVLSAIGWQLGVWLKKNWTIAKKESEKDKATAMVEKIENKASRCIEIASRLFPPEMGPHGQPSQNFDRQRRIEIQAVDFMSMSDSAIRDTITRLNLSEQERNRLSPMSALPLEIVSLGPPPERTRRQARTHSHAFEGTRLWVTAPPVFDIPQIEKNKPEKSLSRYDIAKGKA